MVERLEVTKCGEISSCGVVKQSLIGVISEARDQKLDKA
jgi:hypothetical protein